MNSEKLSFCRTFGFNYLIIKNTGSSLYAKIGFLSLSPSLLLGHKMNDFIWRAACCLTLCFPLNVALIALKTLRSHDALAPVISCIPSAEQITTYSPPPPSHDPNTNKTPAGQAFTGDRTLLFACSFMHDLLTLC